MLNLATIGDCSLDGRAVRSRLLVREQIVGVLLCPCHETVIDRDALCLAVAATELGRFELLTLQRVGQKGLDSLGLVLHCLSALREVRFLFLHCLRFGYEVLVVAADVLDLLRALHLQLVVALLVLDFASLHVYEGQNGVIDVVYAHTHVISPFSLSSCNSSCV